MNWEIQTYHTHTDGDIIRPYCLAHGVLVTDAMWNNLPHHLKGVELYLYQWVEAMRIHALLYADEFPLE